MGSQGGSPTTTDGGRQVRDRDVARRLDGWPVAGARPAVVVDRPRGPHGPRTDLEVELPGVAPEDRGAALARLVAAGTGDVRAHLERSARAVQAGDADAAYGAVLDVLIALGPRARTVRERVLWSAHDLLSRDRFERLRVTLDGGLGATEPLPAALTSVLSEGVEGDGRIVDRARRPARRVRIPGGGPGNDRYDPARYLSGAVELVLREVATDGRARRIGGLWGSIVVLPDETARTAVHPKAFAAACHRRLGLGEPMVFVFESEPVDLRPPRSWDSLRSELAVRCSAGRLSVDIDPHRRYRLRGPVDLEATPLAAGKRLEQALAEPSTQSELAWLIRDPSVVNRFLAAAHATGQLEPVVGRALRRLGRDEVERPALAGGTV